MVWPDGTCHQAGVAIAFSTFNYCWDNLDFVPEDQLDPEIREKLDAVVEAWVQPDGAE